MPLIDIMIDQIAITRAAVEDGGEVIPAWRITTPEDPYLVFTRFDHDTPEQRDRVLLLISRFMTWKMATSFVFTAETWLGAEETREGDNALLCIGVSHHERLGLVQRIRRRDPSSSACLNGCCLIRSTRLTSGCCRPAPARSRRKRSRNSLLSSARMASWRWCG